MSIQTSIEVEGLSVSFEPSQGPKFLSKILPSSRKVKKPRAFTALSDIDIKIMAGERVGILGRNGAGKSTFLRTLAGVYSPQEGTVRVAGSITSIFNVAVGMDRDSTGYENIPLLMASRAIPQSLHEDVRLDVEKFSELGDALNRPVRTYSAGMRLRMAFAVATYSPASLLLMDEVVGVGDRAFRDKSKSRVLSLAANAGTLVIASHSNTILRVLTERGLVFDEGRIVFDGNIDDAINFHENQV